MPSHVITALVAMLLITACGEQKKEIYPAGNRDGSPPAKESVIKGTEGSPEVVPVPKTNVPEAAKPVAQAQPVTHKPGESMLPSPGGPEEFKTGDVSTADTLPAAPTLPAPSTPVAPSLPAAPAAHLGPVKSFADESGRKFTTSSADKLLNALTEEIENPNQPAKVRTQNISAARSIVAAEMYRDPKSLRVLVNLKVREASAVKTYLLSGAIAAPNVGDLTLLSKDNTGVETTGKQSVTGRIKCMDANGECETSVVQFEFATENSEAKVYVIFRQAISDLYIKLPKTSSANPEYAAFAKYAADSIHQANSNARFDEIVMKTFEVVSGRSGVEVEIKALDKQLLAFSSPLVAGDKSGALNIPMLLPAAMPETLAFARLKDMKLSLAETFGAASLVSNNQQGEVIIAVKMRKSGAFPQDAFRLTVTRKLNEIQSVQQNWGL